MGRSVESQTTPTLGTTPTNTRTQSLGRQDTSLPWQQDKRLPRHATTSVSRSIQTDRLPASPPHFSTLTPSHPHWTATLTPSLTSTPLRTITPSHRPRSSQPPIPPSPRHQTGTRPTNDSDSPNQSQLLTSNDPTSPLRGRGITLDALVSPMGRRDPNWTTGSHSHGIPSWWREEERKGRGEERERARQGKWEKEGERNESNGHSMQERRPTSRKRSTGAQVSFSLPSTPRCHRDNIGRETEQRASLGDRKRRSRDRRPHQRSPRQKTLHYTSESSESAPSSTPEHSKLPRSRKSLSFGRERPVTYASPKFLDDYHLLPGGRRLGPGSLQDRRLLQSRPPVASSTPIPYKGPHRYSERPWATRLDATTETVPSNPLRHSVLDSGGQSSGIYLYKEQLS